MHGMWVNHSELVGEDSDHRASFMRKSKKDFTHKGTKHTKLHKEIRASASPSPFGEGRGEAL
jgi:hypothetical protein